jgi:release factor glutamine methyltransferase
LSGLSHLLKWATAALREAGIESPQLDAEVLLAESLGISRTGLYTRLDQRPEKASEKAFRSFVARRLLHEPVAYITGRKEFYGLELQVDRRVLIPRPETETLVEVALTIARQHQVSELADVGVGGGAVAIALAVSLPEVEIYATDSSAQALEVAGENCRQHDVWDRIHLALGDLLDPLPEPVGLVVANLPYVTREELKGLAADITEYEPLSALDGGPDGLDHIRRLLERAGQWLKPPGMICLEIGATQALAVNALAHERFPSATVAVVRDLAGLDRVVIVGT